jgi:hypothetical protein
VGDRCAHDRSRPKLRPVTATVLMHRHDTHHGHGPRGPSRRSRHLGSGRTSVQNRSDRVAKAHPPPHARAVGSESQSSAATVRAAVGHEVFAPFSQSRELYEQRDHADPPHPRQHEGRAKFRLRHETRNSPWPSGKPLTCWWLRGATVPGLRWGGPRPGVSAGFGGDPVAVELHEVVGRRDQPPFG